MKNSRNISAVAYFCYLFCVYIKMSRFSIKWKLAIYLGNDQLDAHLLYFTIRPLQYSTCFEHYMLIIRRLNCIDVASGIVLSVSGRPVNRLRAKQTVVPHMCSRSFCIKYMTRVRSMFPNIHSDMTCSISDYPCGF